MKSSTNALAHGYINGKECMFGDDWCNDKEFNGFRFRYYIRHGDNGNPVSLEKNCPVVNFWGTAYFKQELKFRKYPDMLMIRSWGWQ